MKILRLNWWGWLMVWAALLAVAWGSTVLHGAAANAPIPHALPEVRHHFLEGSEADWIDWLDLHDHYRNLQEERREGVWFAALVSRESGSRGAIGRRFVDPQAFEDFLERADALVEVWIRTAEGPGDSPMASERRLTALELAELEHPGRDLPTWITLTFPDDSSQVQTWRVEFSLQAANLAHDSLAAYAHQRVQTDRMRRILATRDDQGSFSALTQWQALHRAVLAGEVILRHEPTPPTGDSDPFLAYEYAVDNDGRFQGFERVYRESEIEKDLRGGAQQLILRPAWSHAIRFAQAFKRRLDTDTLELCIAPLPGRDAVELRVAEVGTEDPRLWNVLEFGEPEILRQTALAQFGLVNASLEKRRKRLAWKKNTVDLYVEPAIAAANIGGGLAGAGFPFGEALRLAYNLTVAPRFLADVPNVDELRDLFLLLAAKKSDPLLADKAMEWLTEEDLEYLRQRVQDLPPETIRAAAESVSDDDLKAMLSLARMQGWDARYRLFVDVLSSAARISGVSSGTFFGQLLNNPYFSLNGDISIKNILAAMIGEKTLIYPQGGSMQDLIARGGMPKEWLQFFDVTVDVRAIANTLHRLRSEDLAERELRQPFPYAPRLDDLAAYEIRAFGFPLLIYYKRGLLKADIVAYESVYAYTVLGSRIVEHFPTREDFEREIRARRVAPLGYVKVRDAGGRLRDSNLAVFARIFPHDRHGGRTGIVLYGMRAFEEYSTLIERERQRYFDYEALLREGGVIERVVEADDRERLPATTFEPIIMRGDEARATRFTRTLSVLRELERASRLQQWGRDLSPSDLELAAALREEVQLEGIDAGTPGERPFLVVDRYGSTYQFRQKVNGAWRIIERTAVVPPLDLELDLSAARRAREVAEARRLNLRAPAGALVLVNAAIPFGGQTLMGPLLQTPDSAVLSGAGLRSVPAAVQAFWQQIETLPVHQRATLHQGQFAGLPVVLDADRDGDSETVFVTVEFPTATEVTTRRTRPGRDPERLLYRNGRLVEVITPRRITDFEYTAFRQESTTVTYVNDGTLEDPRRGAVVEQTQALDHFLKSPASPVMDVHEARATKVHYHHVLGTTSLETYGAFEHPVRTVTPVWITDHRYDDTGRLSLSRVRPNLHLDTSPRRTVTDQLIHPLPGPERYQLRLVDSPETREPWRACFTQTGGELSAAAGKDSLQVLERLDVLLNVTNLVFHDASAFGRETGRIQIDPFDGTRFFMTRGTNHYRDDFVFGLVPYRTEQFDARTSQRLTTTATLAFDPAQQELIGDETDFKGVTLRKTWRDGNELPVRTESTRRRTDAVVEPGGLSLRGRTVDGVTEEELSRFETRYDADGRAWVTRRVVWHRPNITNRVETVWRSLGGRTMTSRTDSGLEVRSHYDSSGRLATNAVWWVNGPSRQLLRQESPNLSDRPNLWSVRTYINGNAYDEYSVERDTEGRPIRDAIHSYPGLQFWSEPRYDRGTDRVLESKEFQNGQLRLTRVTLPETRTDQGRVLQPVLVRPAWGLVSTQWFEVGDPWGRATRTTRQDGHRVVVREWVPGTAVARVTEVLNPADIPLEQTRLTPAAGEDRGVPYDLLTHIRLGPGGAPGLSSKEALARGTGVTLFREAAGRRVLMALDTPYESPELAIDPLQRRGVSLRLDQGPVHHVLAVLATETNVVAATQPEPGLEQLEVDLESLLFHRVIRRELDARGHLLRESTGRIEVPGQIATRALLLQLASTNLPLRTFNYTYDPGWLMEQGGFDSDPLRWTFVRQPPASDRTAWPVNENGSREFVSSVDGLRMDIRTNAAPDSPESAPSPKFRRLIRPTVTAHNRFLPGLTNLWTSWTARELNTANEVLYEAEVVYDAQGRLRTAQTRKKAGDDGDATRQEVTDHLRTAYVLAEEEFALNPPQRGGAGAGWELLRISPVDWSGSDFVCWQLQESLPPDGAIVIRDANGRELRVGKETARPGLGHLALWMPDASQQLWLPNSDEPQQVCSVSASAALISEDRWLVVAIAELDAAGLDIRQIQSAHLQVPAGNATELLVSQPVQLQRRAPFVALEQAQAVGRFWTAGTDAFNSVTESSLESAEAVDVTGQRSSTALLLNDLEIARSLPPTRPSPHPTLLVIDRSDGESPRPLYALSSRDGHFLKHYRKVQTAGVIQLYTVVNGFDTPLMEVFRRDRLSDEFSPGFLAYGYDYHASVRLQRGSGWFGRSMARLLNRVAANSFNYYGFLLSTSIRKDFREKQHNPEFGHSELHQASSQVEAIGRLPALSRALMAYREPPMRPDSDTPAVDSGLLTRNLALRLLQLHATSFPTNKTPFFEPTYLIPTASDTVASNYVDTAAEADLILLATTLGEYSLAGELLEFYRRKTHEGLNELHAAYDAQTGAAMILEFGPTRAMPSQLTVQAQLGITEAAITLGLKTSDTNWLTFGSNLLQVLTGKYRNERSEGEPRGLTQYRAWPAGDVFGFDLWPNSDRYPVGSNARFYLLLDKIVREGEAAGADPAWVHQCGELRELQQQWLAKYVIPQVRQSGIVPSGFFEIQDVEDSTSGLAAERWSAAEDWLDFLEAALAMGHPRAEVRTWFDHLLRVHAVRVEDNTGLDPGLPLLRPPVLSPNLTARLHSLAREFGDEDLARSATTTLTSLQIEGTFPTNTTDTNGLSLQRPPRTYSVFPRLVTTASTRHALPLGQGESVFPQARTNAWPEDYRPYRHLLAPAPAARVKAEALNQADPLRLNDLGIFGVITALFYALILIVALLWWRFRRLRKGRTSTPGVDERLLAEETIQRTEERWARRVLGVQTPAGAPHTRFSNAAVEQNFLMHLRALYKIVIEWRRQENHWKPDDPRLVEDETDDWINGMDEFASCLGIYLRWVIKAGAKDGLPRKDALEECEDSNHIWSRLVMYLAEPYLGMVTLLKRYNNAVHHKDKSELDTEIVGLLKQLGVRERPSGFDARRLFNYPANPGAFDLLRVQQPGIPLKKLLLEAAAKLRVPYSHLAGMVDKYRAFKRRENPLPLHPYLIEFAKALPHFLLMGLGALILYNQQALADSPIVPYLWYEVAAMFQEPDTLLWAIPLAAGLGFSTLAMFARVYRFEASMLPREGGDFVLDVTVTSLMGKEHKAMPRLKTSRFWNSLWYARAGWVLRAIGWTQLTRVLLSWDTPTFATFLVVKGIFAMLALAELAGIVVPLVTSFVSGALQDLVARKPNAPAALHFINRLNFSASRPASPLALAARYLFQPSVPSGDWRSLAQAMLSYFGLAAAFFFIGVYLCKGILALWFTENYLNASYLKLFFGGLVFWNTMYLLRYGLFLLTTALTSLFCLTPWRTVAALAGLGFLTLTAYESNHNGVTLTTGPLAWFVVVTLAVFAVFEERILKVFRNGRGPDHDRIRPARPKRLIGTVDHLTPPSDSKAGIVYMSGDDLGYLKLNPDLMLTRWRLLRHQLGSAAAILARDLGGWPDDEALEQSLARLYALEQQHQVTLWHPCQLRVQGQESPEQLRNLELVVESAEERRDLLSAWQVRRWVVTMMSTAGHSQDTAINLVDIALRFQADGLASRAVFYLIANKYDNRDNNRPVELPYDQGELQQREKLCQLLEALAPGAHAYNVQNWTPFGFKAGGMTGMDLVPEENLQLSTMVVLDRNATINDMDGFMADLSETMADPNLVIVIPGRGTSNTLTELGQGSQMIEEGHRSFLRGLMGLMGGGAGESLGTGWGNIVAYSYGRIQRAMLDPLMPRMPLTSRMQRGSSFAVRSEGLIGFSPHAVGISEDTWAVSQAAHNLVALGARVRFRLSRAFWHKIRESWSHAEWLASFPRWSGGYLQMMQDGLMQRINDFGPLSIFARELRASSGRAYLTAPFALFNILFLPLAILLDVTPFVQILIVLWNFGFVMNQVLTLHGLNAYLEGAGFSRLGALTGIAFSGLAIAGMAGLQPYAAGLVLLSTFIGGYWSGMSRWAYTRLRDILLFGPQLILHGLGQIMRQTIEFVMSGAAATDAQRVNMAYRAWAGPREDQPLARYPHFINLRTVVWWIGLPSVALNLLALSNLDMFNVVLLLPSLLFSTSVLAGPFLMTPKPGTHQQLSVRLIKWLGWPAAFAVMTAFSVLIARGGVSLWVAAALGLLVLLAMLAVPARHFGFRVRLARLRSRLLHQLAAGGVPSESRGSLVDTLVAQARNPKQVEGELQASPLAAEAQTQIASWVAQRLAPALEAPKRPPPPQPPALQRVLSEFRRAFCVGLLTFLWFLVVPVPGLFVFSAGPHRLSLTLTNIMSTVLGVVVLAIVGHWTAEFLRHRRRRRARALSLEVRALAAFALLHEGWTETRRLSAAETARVAALFTDLMTYLDQKSDAYAANCLQRIETLLATPRSPHH